MTAEGYSYFRDRDGTLCRRSRTTQREVWDPKPKEWGRYFWDDRDVVEISEADVKARWGAEALR